MQCYKEIFLNISSINVNEIELLFVYLILRLSHKSTIYYIYIMFVIKNISTQNLFCDENCFNSRCQYVVEYRNYIATKAVVKK